MDSFILLSLQINKAELVVVWWVECQSCVCARDVLDAYMIILDASCCLFYSIYNLPSFHLLMYILILHLVLLSF